MNEEPKVIPLDEAVETLTDELMQFMDEQSFDLRKRGADALLAIADRASTRVQTFLLLTKTRGFVEVLSNFRERDEIDGLIKAVRSVGMGSDEYSKAIDQLEEANPELRELFDEIRSNIATILRGTSA